MRLKFLSIIGALVLISGCDSADNSYTLYKTGRTPSERIFVNTFGLDPDSQKNAKTCFEAKLEYEKDDKNPAKYWCERGEYNG